MTLNLLNSGMCAYIYIYIYIYIFAPLLFRSSVIDIHDAGYGQRVFNVRLSSDLDVVVVSGLTGVTGQTWRIPRHAWSHVAIQVM